MDRSHNSVIVSDVFGGSDRDELVMVHLDGQLDYTEKF